jgi:hypothetical protein
MMMSKLHKPVNWQARWLLPAAPLLDNFFRLFMCFNSEPKSTHDRKPKRDEE